MHSCVTSGRDRSLLLLTCILMHPVIADMMSLFEGHNEAHGIYTLTNLDTPDNAGKIKGKAATVKRPVTVELWQDHLAGNRGLGIIPINSKSMVKFAALDIDTYPLDLGDLNRKIQENKLPLIVTRTKSGGAHLYIFMTDWADAGMVQRKMREFAVMLGYGDCEIFPKQTKILPERGDIGQWINMPYFRANNSDRYALNHDGKPMSLIEFVDYVKRRKIHAQVLATHTTSSVDILVGGPPCLNHLVAKGFPSGTRNNGLFNLGVYAQKAFPDSWERVLDEMNQRFMDPPLSSTEVLGVIKSLNKKDFQYMCAQPPIKQHCDANKCRNCEFGIGGGGAGLPTFGTLVKVDTQPPIWFLDVEGGGRMELSTEDLLTCRNFQKRALEFLNLVPPLVKHEVWQDIVRRLVSTLSIVEVPPESTKAGQLMAHLEEFCTSRVQGKTHDELLLGKPWTNNKRHYFRLRDFFAYLDRQKFREYPSHEVIVIIKEKVNVEKHFFNIKGKGCNCISVPEFAGQNKPFDEIPVSQDINI